MLNLPIVDKLKSFVSKKAVATVAGSGVALATLPPEYTFKLVALYIIVQGVVDVSDRIAVALTK
jgi:hypothetical protein